MAQSKCLDTLLMAFLRRLARAAASLLGCSLLDAESSAARFVPRLDDDDIVITLSLSSVSAESRWRKNTWEGGADKDTELGKKSLIKN